MHGKAQREPTRHSVVLDCKLVPLQKERQNTHSGAVRAKKRNTHMSLKRTTIFIDRKNDKR